MTSDVSEPLAEPAAVGSEVTLTVHDPLAGIEAPQVLAWLPNVRLDGGDACGGCRKRNRMDAAIVVAAISFRMLTGFRDPMLHS